MKKARIILLGALIALASTLTAFAQVPLVLSINRDFGYAGFDNRIQGLFNLEAKGPKNLARVDFYVDDELISSIDQAPFRVQFSTNSYTPGEHRLHAIGFTSAGEQLQSNEIVRIFLTKEESLGAFFGLIVPMLALILVVILAGAGIPMLLNRKERVGQYGVLGGTVCPKCGLPFALKIFGINWFGGKLQRCPHCGKWSIVRRVSQETLAAAEARYRGEDGSLIVDGSREERTRRQVDESRYEG